MSKETLFKYKARISIIRADSFLGLLGMIVTFFFFSVLFYNDEFQPPISSGEQQITLLVFALILIPIILYFLSRYDKKKTTYELKENELIIIKPSGNIQIPISNIKQLILHDYSKMNGSLIVGAEMFPSRDLGRYAVEIWLKENISYAYFFMRFKRKKLTIGTFLSKHIYIKLVEGQNNTNISKYGSLLLKSMFLLQGEKRIDFPFEKQYEELLSDINKVDDFRELDFLLTDLQLVYNLPVTLVISAFNKLLSLKRIKLHLVNYANYLQTHCPEFDDYANELLEEAK